jgi:hypothetical protein
MSSITTWSRIEPRTRSGQLPLPAKKNAPDPLEAALEARFRDPAWALGRQWQIGELLADDAGSPVQAELRAEMVGLSSYRPSASGSARPLDRKLPLEAEVEREPVNLGLWGSVQLGVRFESALRAAGLGAHIAKFRATYRIPAAAPASEVRSRDGDALRPLANRLVTDGLALIAAARQAAPNYASVQPIPTLTPPAGSTRTPAQERAAVAEIVKELVEFRDAVYSESEAAGAWAADRLHYQFSVGSESQRGSVPLAAPEHGGGRLEWHSFSVAGTPLSSSAIAAVTNQGRTFVPNNVSFHGMPNTRWWEFEDGQTDFGKMETDRVDLAKLLVMEFALVHGDDWFQVPLEVPVGSLSRIKLLLVTNTFGERTAIRPTEAQVPAGEQAWSMFRLTGTAAGSDFLLLPPSAGVVDEGNQLENVLFMRDEMAAMAWAIERRLQGPLNESVDGYETYLRRLEEHPPPGPGYRTADGPDIRYLLGRTVPDSWIPLVPVKTNQRGLLLRRGLMQAPVWTGPAEDQFTLTDIHARGRVLEPWQPFYLNDESVPRAGVEVSRLFRRARTSDGSTFLWLARRARIGRGEGSSGLEWDVVEPLPEQPQA